MDDATHPTVELWIPVVGLEGSYEVSNQGRIRSITRKVRRGSGWGLVRGRILKASIGSAGYPQVAIGGRTVHVHAVVAEAWLGPRPEAHEVCHDNGDRTDSRLANLRYGTKRENGLDRTRHGNNFRANKTHCLRGHEYTPENTATNKTKSGLTTRYCRECSRILRRQRDARRKAERASRAPDETYGD